MPSRQAGKQDKIEGAVTISVTTINKMIQGMIGTRGDISDGYHTFDELYYHRMVLFAIICNTYKNKAWKSKLHDDGTMFDGYFIAGVTTPEGNYTYHYSLEHWEMFSVPELERAPKWDGHTLEDVTRLMSLVNGGGGGQRCV